MFRVIISLSTAMIYRNQIGHVSEWQCFIVCFVDVKVEFSPPTNTLQIGVVEFCIDFRIYIFYVSNVNLIVNATGKHKYNKEKSLLTQDIDASEDT